jgi:hypothetical protein
MMTVVGEEGTTIKDFTIMLKSDFFDSSYLQQNAFDDVDGATQKERQQFVFEKILEVIDLDFAFQEKEEARTIIMRIGNLFKDWNYASWVPDNSDQSEFHKILEKIDTLIKNKGRTEADKRNMENNDRPSSHRLEKAKTLKPDARPRSRQTLSGRGMNEENNQESEKKGNE